MKPRHRSVLLLLVGLLHLGTAIAVHAGYTASTSSTTNGGGSFGPVLRMSVSISGKSATFTVSKISGTFESSGTMYLKENGNASGSRELTRATVSQGASSVKLTIPDLATLSSPPDNVYARFESSAGSHSWVGPITISFFNSTPGLPTISASPTSAKPNIPVTITVTRGSDPDGDPVKVRCTADHSNYTDQSFYESGFATGGTSVTVNFTFFSTGTKTIYCSSFDLFGAGGVPRTRTISIIANRTPSSPSISATPSSAFKDTTVNVNVTRGTDPDGDNVKIECTAEDSNWPPGGTPFKGNLAAGGTTETVPFTFHSAGSKRIWCASFDPSGLNSPDSSRLISIQTHSASGTLTLPSTSITGPVSFTASASATAGLKKVSVVFWNEGTPYVLCEDATSNPCSGTSDSWSVPDVDPRWYSASPGTLPVGLWVRDDLNNTTLVSSRSLNWQPASTGALTSPSGSGGGVVRVTANATTKGGFRKVSVVFVEHGTPLVLCEDGTANACPSTSSGSWSRLDVNPRDYSVSGTSSLVLGLWVLDDLNRVENVHRQPFNWEPAGNGSFSSPGSSATGPVTVAVSASAPRGMQKVSVVFVENGPPLVMCEDGTATPCTGSTWQRTGVDPRAYGVPGAGTMILGLWIRDDQSRVDRVATRSVTWTPSAPPTYLNVSDWAQAAAHFLVGRFIVVDPANHDLRGTSALVRADLATMLYRALGGGLNASDASFAGWYGGVPTPRFVDVADPAVWYFKPVTYLGALDFGDGVTVFDQAPGIFRPANNMSRGWTVKALLESRDIQPLTSFSGVSLFDDVPTSHPAAGYIYQAAKKGIVTGTNNHFRPDDNATREDLFLMLHRLLDSQANALRLSLGSPAPLARGDFAGARPLRRIGTRYEQPIVRGARTPSLTLTATALARETVGALSGVYTSTLQASLSGVDGRTFADSRGISRQARPFCSWSATSGGFLDLTLSGGIPFSRVKWLAPADVSAASGAVAEAWVTVYCGDNLGHEVRAARLLSLSSRSGDSTLPTVTLSPLPTGRTGGQLAEIQGTARDGGDSTRADFGILRVELFWSRDNGATWTRLGAAPLDEQGNWRFRWFLPLVTGNLQVRALATNLRGNVAQTAARSMTLAQTLALEGAVVDGRGRPVENARVTLTGGGLNLTRAADNNGSFRFSTSSGTALLTGVAYNLAASFDGKTATVSGLTLTAQTGVLRRVLILDLAPPVTVASVPGGSFTTAQTVELICRDDHSGCAATYYTLNGTIPTTSSAPYAGPLTLSQSTTLKFFSVDAAGNREPVVSEAYFFGTCGFGVSSSGASLGPAGGTGSVNVTTPAGCAWTASSGAAWITLTAGASGNGNGTVSFSVAANPGTSSRTGTLTIAGQTFTVTQAASQPGVFVLRIEKSGTGSGFVTSSPAGLDCGAICEVSRPAGSLMTLLAVPSQGSLPVMWSGDPDCTDGIVTLNANRLCRATFELEGAPPEIRNLIKNPAFIDGLNEWSPTGQGSATWDTVSHGPGSGSVLITGGAGFAQPVLSQCVPVDSDMPYDFESWFFFEGVGTPGLVYLWLSWYDQPDCLGRGLTDWFGSSSGAGSWYRLNFDLRSPQTAASARLYLMVQSTGAGPVTVRFDDLSLLSTLLFRDGFESGDRSKWSSPPP